MERPMKVAIPDLISNSYFSAEAAVELGFFREEGIDVILEMIFSVDKAYCCIARGGGRFCRRARRWRQGYQAAALRAARRTQPIDHG